MKLLSIKQNKKKTIVSTPQKIKYNHTLKLVFGHILFAAIFFINNKNI